MAYKVGGSGVRAYRLYADFAIDNSLGGSPVTQAQTLIELDPAVLWPGVIRYMEHFLHLGDQPRTLPAGMSMRCGFQQPAQPPAMFDLVSLEGMASGYAEVPLSGSPVWTPGVQTVWFVQATVPAGAIFYGRVEIE